MADKTVPSKDAPERSESPQMDRDPTTSVAAPGPDVLSCPDGPDSAPRKHSKALRGATTVDEDTAEQVTARTCALLTEMVERNGVDHDDIIWVLFTATDDIHSMFPATAARGIGFGDIPLLCARELDIDGGQSLCIRILMHLETPRRKLHHVYLEGSRGLRDDLPE